MSPPTSSKKASRVLHNAVMWAWGVRGLSSRINPLFMLLIAGCQTWPIADISRSDAELKFYDDEHLAPRPDGRGTSHYPGGDKLVLNLFDLRDRPGVSHTMNYDSLTIEIDTRETRGTFRVPSKPIRLLGSKGRSFSLDGHVLEGATGRIELLGLHESDLVVRFDLHLDYAHADTSRRKETEGFSRVLAGTFRFQPGRNLARAESPH